MQNDNRTTPIVITKQVIRVHLVLVDGSTLDGALFLAAGERLQDLLNDPKSFLPFRTADQAMLMINKASISVCRPIDA